MVTLSQSKGLTVWLTGLIGSGKSTIARSVHAELLARGIDSELLDADELRGSLHRDLGFTEDDRNENVRRIGAIAEVLTQRGFIVLVAAISPYRRARRDVRNAIKGFIEVYVNTPLAVCEERDPKGLYKKARRGEIRNFTGIDDSYEVPAHPDICCDTHTTTLTEITESIIALVLRRLS